MEVYFSILQLGKRCSIVRGNHDEWLAAYLFKYCNTPERKRLGLPLYPYNSFVLLAERLTLVDLEKLAETIRSWPLQISLEIGGEKYLLAHADTGTENWAACVWRQRKNFMYDAGCGKGMVIRLCRKSIWSSERKESCHEIYCFRYSRML